MTVSRIAAIAVAGTLTVGPAPAVAASACQTPIGYAVLTGVDVTWAAATGALLILAGMVALVATRRRRTTVRSIRGGPYG